MSENSALRYVPASQVGSPAGVLGPMALLGSAGQSLGSLDGVLVDPVERRLRYFVVRTPDWVGARRHLLSSDCPVQIDSDSRCLRFDLGIADLALCEEFKTASAPQYSDDDLIDTLFGERIA